MYETFRSKGEFSHGKEGRIQKGFPENYRNGGSGHSHDSGRDQHPAGPGQAATTVDRSAVIAALGDTIIPSDPGDPGYRTLEPYNITALAPICWRTVVDRSAQGILSFTRKESLVRFQYCP